MDIILGKIETLPKYQCISACSYRKGTKMFISSNHRSSRGGGQRNKTWGHMKTHKSHSHPLFRHLKICQLPCPVPAKGIRSVWWTTDLDTLHVWSCCCFENWTVYADSSLKDRERTSHLLWPHQMGLSSPLLYSHNALFLSPPGH